ncbi:hypothetical protein K502DRAFT_364815 [Neoconidiobolus thromboides FSU 785]|nr:hypothetical protein K502DRAFT_364815 [Neoconidiobolus thromboides FSU 785]
MYRFNNILNKKFATSQEAIEYCQYLAHACGFSVRIRTSKATTIYIVCSREGKPDMKADFGKKRNRNSDRCNCQWRIVLYYNEDLPRNMRWEFREGKSMVHNHSVFNELTYPSYTCTEQVYNQSSSFISNNPHITNNNQAQNLSYNPFGYRDSSSNCTGSSSPSPNYLSTYTLPPMENQLKLPPIHWENYNPMPKKQCLPNSLQFILN